MNRTFKTIFNKTRCTYMVAGENVRAHGKTKSVKAIAAVALLGVGGFVMNGAWADQTDITADAPIVVTDSQVIDNSLMDGYISKTTAGGGDSSEKGAIEVKENGSILITGSTFTNNKNGIDTTNGELVKPGAGVLYVNKDATGRIENSTFSKNKDYYFNKTIGDKSAGAIFNNGNLTVENTTFSENADNFQGGAINNYYDGTLTVSNSKFNNNGRYAAPASDNRWGGAIINYGKMNDTDSTYTQNAAVTGGGAIYTYGSKQELVIKGDSFTGNSASHGGAIYIAAGKMEDIGSSYIGNKSSNSGGAIYTNGQATIKKATFTSNVTDAIDSWAPAGLRKILGGGAIINTGSDAVLNIESSSFNDNEAKGGYGGAIANIIGKEVNLKSVNFANNSAGREGGAIYNGYELYLNKTTGEITKAGTAGVLTIGGVSSFTGNTASGKSNDIANDGILNFGSGRAGVAERAATSEKEILEHKYTYIGSGISGFGDMALNSGELEIAEGKHVEQGSATFKSGTTTTITLNSNHILKKDIVENASEVKDQIAGTVDQGGYTFHTTGGGLKVENGAVLQVAGAQANNTYLVAYNTGVNGMVDTNSNGWREEGNLKQTKIESTSKLLKLKRVDGDTEVEASLEEKEEIPPVELRSVDDSAAPDVNGTVMITAEAADISEVLPCVDAPKNLTEVASKVDTTSDKAGVRFLSRATDIRYLSDTDQMTKTINSAVQIGSLGGVKDMTFSGSNMFQRSIENHLSLSRTLQLEKEDIKLHEKDHTDLWIDVIGQHTRRTGISGTCHGKECNDGNADSYGLRTDMGAIIVGLDRTNKEGDKHWGIAGMLGTGHAGSTGHLNHTKNDIDFWGLSLYGGIDRDNWNLMGNIAYSHFSSDIEQNLPSSLGMGNKLKADVSSHLWSVGGKAEYRYDLNESTAIKPHAGLRWDRMTTSGFSTKAQGETVFTTKRDTQDIYSLPVGLAFETGLKTDSGWVIRPQGDIAIVFAAGDLKDTNRFSATGVDAYDTIRTRIVDSTSITASVGVDMQKGNKSFGLHYDAVSSSNQLWQGFMAKFVYKFE